MAACVHTEFFSGRHFLEAYAFEPPPAALSGWVSSLWQSRFEALYAADHTVSLHERSFAQLSCSVVISNGSPFFVQAGNEMTEVKNTIIIGHQARPLLFHHDAGNRLEGVKLKPGGFYRLFGIPASLLQDAIVPVDELLGKKQAYDLRSLTMLAAERSCKADLYKFDNVQKALSLYDDNMADNMPLDKIAWRLHFTSKTLNRYFHETIGIAPKKAFSIMRIRKALHDLAQMRNKKQFSLYGYGFTDRSHFYKDLRAYTSIRSLSNI